MATEGPNRHPFHDAIDDLSTALGATYINFLMEATFNKIDGVRTNMCYLVDTGTHACNEWQHRDNIRIICLTNSRATLFWEVVKENLFLKDTFAAPAGNVLELSSPQLGGDVHTVVKEIRSLCRQPEMQCKIFLHYCKMPQDFVVAELAPANATTHLDLVLEMQQLGRDVREWPWLSPDGFTSLPPPLAHAYRTLRLWARSNGILGPHCGYFDSMTLIWVVTRAYHKLASEELDADVGASAVQQAAFTILKDRICDTDHGGFSVEAARNGTISKTLQPPNICASSGRRVTDHMKAHAIEEIKIVLQSTESRHIIQPYEDLSSVSDRLQEGWSSFSKGSAAYILVHRSTWAPSLSKLEEYRSRTWRTALAIMAELFSRHRLPDSDPAHFKPRPRLWPEVLLREDGSGESEACVIALGTARLSGRELNMVYRVLEDVEAGNLKDCPRVDTTHDCALIFPQVKPNIDLFIPESMIPPPANLPSFTDETSEPTSDELSFENPPARFRTASQAIARLRHDPAHAAVEYDLAYEDRFAGLMWMPLEEWGGRATEDEDFIPEHRVRLVKRRRDSFVVWDRVARIDTTGGLFYSSVGWNM